MGVPTGTIDMREFEALHLLARATRWHQEHLWATAAARAAAVQAAAASAHAAAAERAATLLLPTGTATDANASAAW